MGVDTHLFFSNLIDAIIPFYSVLNIVHGKVDIILHTIFARMNPDSVFFRQLPYKIDFPLIPVPEHKVLTVLYQIIQVILSGKLINLSVQSIRSEERRVGKG